MRARLSSRYHHIVSTALPPAKGEPPLAIAVSFWYPVVHSATRLLKHWLHRDHERPNNLLDVAIGSRFDEQAAYMSKGSETETHRRVWLAADANRDFMVDRAEMLAAVAAAPSHHEAKKLEAMLRLWATTLASVATPPLEPEQLVHAATEQEQIWNVSYKLAAAAGVLKSHAKLRGQRRQLLSSADSKLRQLGYEPPSPDPPLLPAMGATARLDASGFLRYFLAAEAQMALERSVRDGEKPGVEYLGAAVLQGNMPAVLQGKYRAVWDNFAVAIGPLAAVHHLDVFPAGVQSHVSEITNISGDHISKSLR